MTVDFLSCTAGRFLFLLFLVSNESLPYGFALSPFLYSPLSICLHHYPSYKRHWVALLLFNLVFDLEMTATWEAFRYP